MFTGIIEEIGRLRGFYPSGRGARLEIEATRVLRGTAPGDSISVNGVCLTVTGMAERSFAADVSEETVRRTTLARLRPGSAVNLERALTLSSRLGGHIVLGHVDGVGQVERIRESGEGFEIHFRLPPALAPFIAEKGAIAVDGVSLTVAGLSPSGFWVAIIPQTARATIIGQYRPGTPVNLEVDVLARYVHHLMRRSADPMTPVPASRTPDTNGSANIEGIDWEQLAREGW